MKILAFAFGALLAGAAGAADGPRAELVGQRVISSYPGSPILVCRYRTAEAKYEVVAASASCAPYLALEQDGNRGTFASIALTQSISAPPPADNTAGSRQAPTTAKEPAAD
jgi:hypothetical protein